MSLTSTYTFNAYHSAYPLQILHILKLKLLKTGQLVISDSQKIKI